MRLASAHGGPGVEIFVHGVAGGGFPVRQHAEAGRAIARAHGLDPARTLHIGQSEAAIAAGAFHNDVVAVADGLTLFAHEQAFADPAGFYAELRRLLPEVSIVEVPASAVPLGDAVTSYLFNAQLVTLPEGGQALILPAEARETASVWTWLQEMVAGNGPIRRLELVDVRQSMANGGGPACLRLRVVADPATIDPRFLVDNARLDRIAALVERQWPERIAPDQLADPALWEAIERARLALLDVLELNELA
jgi:succinylarginine dihydrolase